MTEEYRGYKREIIQATTKIDKITHKIELNK